MIDADRRQGNTEDTVRFHRDKGRHLVRLLGRERHVAALQLGDLNSYTDTRLTEGAHRHTIQKEVRTLLQALYCAKEIGLYDGDPKALKPKAFRKKSRYYKPRARWLESVAQAQALIDNTSTGPQMRTDRRLHIAAYLHTGVRKSELYAILPQHVSLEKRTVWVDGTKTDGAPRLVWLSATALAVFKAKLADAQAGRPLFEAWASADRDLRGAYRRAREAAAELAKCEPTELQDWPEDVSFNDLRRTFCSLMASAGVPLQHCAAMLGHGSIDMALEVYARLAPASLLAAVDALPALAVPGVTDVVTSIVREDSSGARSERGQDAKTA